MDINAFLEQARKVKNYAENLSEIDRVSALDEAILKKNVESLYEILVQDYMGEDNTGYASSTPEIKSKVVEENISFSPVTIERDNTRVSEAPKTSEPIFDFSDNDDTSTEVITETPEPSKEEPEITTATNSDLDELFNIEEGSELSHKLSQTKVTDIMKAMGLNERIFTQNELFGGDNQVFQDVIGKLNQVETFEEAKNILGQEVASKYEWNKADRKQIARNFIRLIHRRYK